MERGGPKRMENQEKQRLERERDGRAPETGRTGQARGPEKDRALRATKPIKARVNPQTAWHLREMAKAEGLTVGQVIDRMMIAARKAQPRPEIKKIKNEKTNTPIIV